MTKEQRRMILRVQSIGMIQHLRHDPRAGFVLALSPTDMKAQDIEPLAGVLEMLLLNTETVRSLKSRLTFDWREFAGEEKEADELPFVRIYLETISEKFPYWFWFVSKNPSDINLKWLFYCLAKNDWQSGIGGRGTEFVLRSFSPQETANFMRKYAAATCELQKKFDLSDAEIKENLRQTEKYFRGALTGFDWSQMPAGIFV